MKLLLLLAVIGHDRDLQGSEILTILQNGIPRTLTELHDTVSKNGSIEESLIPFSGGTFFTSLYESRLVHSSSPKFFYSPIPRLDGTVDMKFISWNEINHEYDFGLFINFGSPTCYLQKSNISSCIDCHKGLSPIISDRAWLNANGANAPIGTYISMAFLRTRHEIEPEKYARFFPEKYSKYIGAKSEFLYDQAFGNLSPETAISLGSVLYHGTPVFQLRGTFNFDANVRRAHYMAFTYQILKALPDDLKLAFSKTLVLRALKAMMFPERIDLLFAWDQYLEAWVKAYPYLQKLPGNNSPILENFQPLFDNHDLLLKAGITEVEVDADPVEALVRLGRYVQTNKIKTYPPDRLTSLPKSFIKMKPNHNGGADTALELLTGFTKRDAKVLRHRLPTPENLNYIYNSAAWDRAWTKEVFPSRLTILKIVGDELVIPIEELDQREVKNEVTFTKGLHTPAAIVQSNERHPCLNCHGKAKKARLFPFDPAKLDGWKAFQRSNNEEAQEWIEGTYERLTRNLMPPSTSEERKGFSLQTGEWRAIYEFLKQNAK